MGGVMADFTAQCQEMISIGRLLYKRQLIVATEGNLSIRLGGDRFLVTPAGVCKGFMNETDLLVTTANSDPSNLTSASSGTSANRPSSEWPLHLEIYEQRPDMRAICHAHPPWATAFAAAGLALDGCLLPEIINSLGMVPLADYGTPGTEELPAAVRGWITTHDALLLANHGVVTTAASLTEAYFKLESVERLAQVTLLARLAGGEQRLTAEQVTAVRTLATESAGSDASPVCVPLERSEEVHATTVPTQPSISRENNLERIADRLARAILGELK